MLKNIEEYLNDQKASGWAKKKIVKKEPLKLSEVLQKSLPKKDLSPSVIEVGEVIYIGDGICKVTGLKNARIDDVLKVKSDAGEVLVLVLGITSDLVETVVLGDYFSVKKGNLVFSTQKTLKIPAGKNVLGRVISPIGRPLDGKGEIQSSKLMDVERPAPAVYMRTPITEQVKTGFLVVDSIIPIGKGQRELVTGDRKTGKTRLVCDIICNLKDKDMYCIYVAIGAQKAKVKSFAQYLEKNGALSNSVIVVGSSDDPPSLNYLAPYSGSAIAEYFSDNGKNALVVYDDLSKHAKAYRQMSLLLKRSPGRDAYPGDIFYLHSRLLERSAKVSEKFGGGSITAMPICETQNGDISEYITTNLMSITDGHIYLDSKLMHDGILPAVDSTSSVSRIGGSIQPKQLRKFGSMAGSQLARYNEVKSYETMNTEITEETEREINRGKRILEFFNQASGVCYAPAEESILIYTATSGIIDHIPIDQVSLMKKELVDFYRQNILQFKTLTDAAESKDSDDKNLAEYENFLHQYIARTTSDPAKALDEAFHKKQEKEDLEKAAKAAKEEEDKKSQTPPAPTEPNPDKPTEVGDKQAEKETPNDVKTEKEKEPANSEAKPENLSIQNTDQVKESVDKPVEAEKTADAAKEQPTQTQANAKPLPNPTEVKPENNQPNKQNDQVDVKPEKLEAKTDEKPEVKEVKPEEKANAAEETGSNSRNKSGLK